MTKDERIAELERKVERLKRIREDFRYSLKLLEERQTQKAIECLKGLRYFIVNLLIGNYDRTMEIICEQIDYKIKELEGDGE